MRKTNPKGNPNPVQTDFFKSKQNPRAENDPLPKEPLSEKPITIKVYQFVYDAIAQMPKNEKAVQLRELITEFAIKELGAMPTTIDIQK